ncbi:hypothetical protein [Halomonas sp. SpR8]|uniref:hypothetical protein n=1 Tax=Halomonas sp. SpR8 TaxID=3050463 RepID=UPI0027E43D9A|nr:hypothetical protein [Halomonas sp. SpR8]MDQ7730926.1 hypothetical protein [Halomonas sp. SpR8]
MLVIELNEFSADLLRKIAGRENLTFLQEVLQWHQDRSWSEDTYDSGFLEPWVQWVSVHSGVPSTTHQIKNLGDIPSLSAKQIWEKWSDKGQSSVIWGVMNGSRGTADKCHAFIPDPWTFSENAYPSEYTSLIELPRYLAKNYLDISKRKVALSGSKLLASMIRHTSSRDFLDAMRFLVQGLKQFGPAHIVFIVFFEYLSAMAFLRATKRFQPDHAILFLNTLAHTQHHYWLSRDGHSCPQLAFAAKAINEILTKVFQKAPPSLGEKKCVMNALSQTCTLDEPAWILHRPHNPASFIELLGIKPISIEPLMTHDAHLHFSTQERTQEAYDILRSVEINGKPMLHVEKNLTDSRVLFYRLDFFNPVDDSTVFQHNGTQSRFKEHFASIVKRTGKHIPEGTVLTNWEAFDRSIYNHEILETLTEQDKKSSASALKSRQEERDN